MMAKTHNVCALTVTAFALETADWKLLAVAAIAAQLPDVDTSTSLAGRLCFPLSRWLEYRFPHRTVTHSFLATAFLALLTLPLWWQGPQLWSAVLIGYFCGWFGDVFTKSGVAAFYPLSPARLVIPANPRLRLTTGTRAEYVVGSMLLLGFLLALNLNTNGGLLRSFNTWLAQPEGVVTLFVRASAHYQILAHIEGRFVASAAQVAEEFEVLEVEGEKLLVRAPNGLLYWAGHAQSCASCHLDIHRVQARLGAPITTEARELQWQEQELSAVIGGEKAEVGTRNAELTTRNAPTTDHPPPTTILFSGELLLRDADSLHLSSSLQHFNPIEIVGNSDEWARWRTVRVRAATLQDLVPLQRYFGSGHLMVRIIRGGTP